jgi:hypothetical protein
MVAIIDLQKEQVLKLAATFQRETPNEYCFEANCNSGRAALSGLEEQPWITSELVVALLLVGWKSGNERMIEVA